nr:MAG TPA: tail protein [Bacteriophage sp.]
MINVSDEFKQLMTERQNFKCNAEVTLANGTVLPLGEDDFSIDNNSLVDAAGANTIPLGVALSRNVQLEIMNDDDHLSNYDFFGAKIRLYLTFELSETTEKIEYGTFTVTQPESYGNVVTIVGYDDMYKADKAYSTTLTFPATAKSVLVDSCDTCGILIGDSNFLHNDFQIPTMPSSEYTHRQIIGFISMIACGNARIDRTGHLQIMTYDFNYNSGNIHDLTDYNTLTNDTNDVQVTGVQMTRTVKKTVTDEEGNENEEDVEETVKVGADSYILSLENPLVKGHEETLVSWVYDKFKSVTFRGFTMDYISYPIAEFMDKIKVTDWRENSFYSVLTDVNFVFFGYTTLKNSAESPLRNQSNYTSSNQKAIIQGKQLVEQERNNRQNAVDKMQEALKNSNGMYSTQEVLLDGSTIYYLHDKPTIKESKNVIKLTADVIGFSIDGGKTYPYGFTITGEMVARLLYTEGINADYINTGALTVKDKSGNIIFYADMETGTVKISGDNVTIGGKTAPEAISDAVKESKNYADGKVSDFAETVTKSVSDLQNQIDGQIETFYYDYEPNLKNIPASDWTTEDDKKKHEGDLFYWKSKGYAYRFFKDGDTWKWQLVQDTDVTKALQTASFAQSTANSKCRVFLTQPTPPYDTGDMWNQGQNGDILTCVVARADGASYVETDWQKLNKYTDDETANKALEEARKSRAMIINLDNDYQAITTDYKGEYTSFPECHTTAQVLYGHTDISNDCTYNVQKSGGVVGSWNNSTHTYTVTALTTDVGWVDITANYLNTYSVTKRFDIAKLKGGIPGETGAKGDKGETGASGRSITGSETTYQASSSGTTAPTGTWSKTPPSVAENQYLWTRTIYTYSDKTTSTTYSIGKMGAKGEQGAKGETGATGPQGEKGAKGNDGVSPTVSISKSGTVTTITITDKNGTHTQTVNDGTNGTAGKAGADGKTPYFHVKYSNDGGKTFTSNSGEDVGTYIGTCTDYNQADPTTVGSYTWARIKGETGATGAKGETGATGPQGPQGNIGPTGNGIKSTAITYQVSSSGTAVPTGTWSGSVPSTSAGQYLWTRTITTYTNNTTTTSYSVSRNGSNGAKGDKGDQGSAGRTYFMETSSSIVKMSADNTIVPNYITLSGYYRDGTATARTAYKCRFKIEETTDGDTYTTVYTSSADETDITHALYSVLASGSSGITASGSSGIGISRNLTALRCTMYAAGGFSQVLDIETIPVAIDVDALTHEDIFNLLTNDGAWQGIYRGSDGKLYINFTYARGGTLNLGGKANTYGNGQMHVYDANDNEIVDINTKGIVVTHYISGMGEKPISYVCITPDVFGGIYLSENKDGTGACAILSPDEIVLKNNSSGPITVQTDITMHMTDESLYLGSVSNYKFHFGKEKSSFYQPVTIGGSLSVAGTKNRIIDTENYDTRKQYCYETATPYFGDIGSGCTDNTGKCYIDINDIFSETVNTGVEYQVFLQKEGQGDIWVEEKTDSYFVVKGTENLKFSWEIKAIQKDYEFERLEKFDNSEKEEVIDYEKEYMEEINDLIKEQEEMLNETVE